MKQAIKSTAVAIREYLKEKSIPLPNDIIAGGINEYDLLYTADVTDFDQDELVIQLKEAGLNPREEECRGAGDDFEFGLEATDEYMEGLDDGQDVVDTFHVLVDFPPEKIDAKSWHGTYFKASGYSITPANLGMVGDVSHDKEFVSAIKMKGLKANINSRDGYLLETNFAGWVREHNASPAGAKLADLLDEGSAAGYDTLFFVVK